MTTQATPTVATFSRPTAKILRRILRASRLPAGKKLATILESVVTRNDHPWECLFYFSSRCLRLPQRGAQGGSLATLVNRQIEAEADLPDATANPHHKRGRNLSKDPLRSLAGRVSAKLEEGDFKGAIRIACSEETLAPPNDTVICSLPN